MTTKIRCVKTMIKNLDDGPPGSYDAYVSVFGNEDSDGDIIHPGFFTKTIKKRNGTFPGVWFHDPRRPVSIGQVEEDGKGLVVHAQINLDTQDGQETYSNMKMGIVGDHSFAFDPIKYEQRTNDEGETIRGRDLYEGMMFEYSVLTNGFAANPLANLIALKMRNGEYIEHNGLVIPPGTDGDPISDQVDSLSDDETGDSPDQAKEITELAQSIKDLTSNVYHLAKGV